MYLHTISSLPSVGTGGRVTRRFCLLLALSMLLVSFIFQSAPAAAQEQQSSQSPDYFVVVSSEPHAPTAEQAAALEAEGIDATPTGSTGCWSTYGDLHHSVLGLGSVTHRLYLDYCWYATAASWVNSYDDAPISTGIGVSYNWSNQQGCVVDTITGYPTCTTQVSYTICANGWCQTAYPFFHIKGYLSGSVDVWSD